MDKEWNEEVWGKKGKKEDGTIGRGGRVAGI